jgi:YhcH/YjgK/YiaL family protein
MYLSHIATLDRDAALLPDDIRRGLRFLAGTDINSLPAGRVDIDGDRMFALVQDYDTVPKAEKRPESHARYIDIQYVARGREAIGYAPLSGDNPVEENFFDSRDVQFFASVADESDLILGTGAYAVFYPTDIHRPGCIAGAPEKVRKVVVKILA